MGKWEPTRLALIFRYTFVKQSNNGEKGGKGRVWKSYSHQVWFTNKHKSLAYRRKGYTSCTKIFLTLQHNFWNNEQYHIKTMKIDSPSSITPREASIRLEWISTRILPGVAVLLLSIPLCQWADSNLPDGIVPVSIIYLMIVIILWSTYMAMQYAFVGIAQTRKAKTHACNNQNATNESTAQKPVFLLEAIPIINESENIDTICEVERRYWSTPERKPCQFDLSARYWWLLSKPGRKPEEKTGHHSWIPSIHHVPFCLWGRHGRVLYRPVEIRNGSQLSPWSWVEEIQDKAEQLRCPPFSMEHCHQIGTWQRQGLQQRWLRLLYRASFCFIVRNSQWRTIVA